MHTPDSRYVITERDIFRTTNGKPGAWLPYNGSRRGLFGKFDSPDTCTYLKKIGIGIRKRDRRITPYCLQSSLADPDC